MPKLTLDDVASLTNESTAITTINGNSDLIETALENTLSRDGTAPNTMEANLDMNSNRIQNLPEPVASTEPLRLGDVGTLVADLTDISDYVQDASDFADAASASATAAAASAAAADASADAAALSATAADDTLTLIETVVTNATPSFVNFSGTGAQTTFALGSSPAETNVIVFVDGVHQSQGTWSISGSDLVFSTAPPTGTDNIEVVIGPFGAITTTTIGGVSGLQNALDAKANLTGATFSGAIQATTITATNDIIITDDLSVGGGLAVTDDVTIGGTINLALGTEALPSYRFTGDPNTGMWSSAANLINFSVGGSEVLELGASSIIVTAQEFQAAETVTGGKALKMRGGTTRNNYYFVNQSGFSMTWDATDVILHAAKNGSSGWIGVNNTLLPFGSEEVSVDGSIVCSIDSHYPDASDNATDNEGVSIDGSGFILANNYSGTCLQLNRMGTDGEIIGVYAQGTKEASVTVSGSAVTWGPFTGGHWSQLSDNSKPDIPRGTVVESISERTVREDGRTIDKLPRFQICHTIGSKAVYGVFGNWDEENGANIISLGTFFIRLLPGTVVEPGDLIEAGGLGCGRVQSDDIVRSRTVGKVTSNEVIETYSDGSFLVPCTLHCG